MNETISLVLGAILPPFIDFLTKKVSNTKVRFGISLGVCILIGFGISFNNFKPSEILQSVALVFTSAQIVYKTYWAKASLRSEDNK